MYRSCSWARRSWTTSWVAESAGRRSERRQSRLALAPSASRWNLGVLAFSNNTVFHLVASARRIFWRGCGLPASDWTLKIFLPCRFCFYVSVDGLLRSTFIGVTPLRPVRSFLDLAFFVHSFPATRRRSDRARDHFLPQLREMRVWQNVDVRGCLMLFASGLREKVHLQARGDVCGCALRCAAIALRSSARFIGVLFYAVQIYCDFSGYTDMAIATARLLGYELTANFNFPYFAANITEFWRRWHISLSTWLRDYLYIPLGGNRGSKLFTYRNLMLTMLLGGLWHGASWNFVIWGGLHGIAP